MVEDVDLDEDVFANVGSDEFGEENTVEATADVDQAIMDDFTDDVTQVISDSQEFDLQCSMMRKMTMRSL